MACITQTEFVAAESLGEFSQGAARNYKQENAYRPPPSWFGIFPRNIQLPCHGQSPLWHFDICFP